MPTPIAAPIAAPIAFPARPLRGYYIRPPASFYTGFADREINAKWTSLGGAPGPAKDPRIEGVIQVSKGRYYREYLHGRIYSDLGNPTYWVYGSIGDKYTSLGGPGSWLGWPKSDDQPFGEGGSVLEFEHGAIYWWPDTGAIELGNIALRYAGLACFSETDDEGDLLVFSSADEPYMFLTATPSPPYTPVTTRTTIKTDVDSGDTREEVIELFRGRPYGALISATLMEHDSGDPDKYRGTVEEAVKQGSKGVVAGVGFIPYVGPYLAPLAESFLKEAGPDIVDGINGALGTDDDHVGTVELFVSSKDMVKYARAPHNNYGGILWHLETPLIKGDGGVYKAYFDIVAV